MKLQLTLKVVVWEVEYHLIYHLENFLCCFGHYNMDVCAYVTCENLLE